jgi:hypothetical protein
MRVADYELRRALGADHHVRAQPAFIGVPP